ncbi:MAG: response regulator, partial [Elusimicrobiota bacterium]
EFGANLNYGSSPEGGARFSMNFPPCPADLPEANPLMHQPPCVPGQRVLVVDDEPNIVHLVLRLLQEDGLLVTPATDPHEAMRMIQKGGIDLVITDLDMGPVLGTDLAQSARTAPEPPAFLFMTGDVLNQPLMAEVARLDIPVLSKPFLRTEFLRLVRRTLHERKSTQRKAGYTDPAGR